MEEHTHKINLSQMEAEQRYLLPKCSSDIIIVSDLRTGVTGKSIPPAGLYPGLKRPKLDYTRVLVWSKNKKFHRVALHNPPFVLCLPTSTSTKFERDW